MCGIAALFSQKGHDNLSKMIAEMCSLVNHRGPDDEGFALFNFQSPIATMAGGQDTPSEVYQASLQYTPKQSIHMMPAGNFQVALGHRRLSILDLSPAGHQPLCLEEGHLWITFNGEAYNYVEIRQELMALGINFKTHTDTEVVLKAYQQWGVKSFSKLNGMFAFVIYDSLKREMIAVRDRFGVKPLYYWKSPNGLIAFASEIKQFTVLPGWQASMNGQRVYDFLNWGSLDHTAETCFSGVKQLRGGEYVVFAFDNVKPEPKKWYELTPIHFDGDFNQASVRFKELLESSIQLRLRADVDIGSCLSGGLDSSSIVCLANGMLRKSQASVRQKTFSACSDVKLYDESDFIKSVVSSTGVEAHYTYPQLADVFNECSDIVWHQDEPFGSTSIYAQWLVFKKSKEQGVKVMLDGQGADEQLAGYHGFFGNHCYDLFKTWHWKKLFDEMKATKAMHSLNALPMLINKLVPHAIGQPLRRLMGLSATKPDWLNLNVLKANDVHPHCQRSNKSVLGQSIQQLSHTSVPMLLHWEDRDSMAHSVESRTPFLDYRLVEFTLGLASEYKISGGWTKRVLRESMKGILPEEIRTRIDKMAFATAEEEWLKKQDPYRFQTALKAAFDKSEGILTPKSLNLVHDMVQGKRPFSFLPWRIITLGYWFERFNVKI